MRRIIATAVAVIGIVAIAGCGSSSDESAESTPASEEVAEAPSSETAAADAESDGSGYGADTGNEAKEEEPSGAAITLADSQFGEVLFGGENDQAIYLFANDGPDASNCSGDCAAAWPPVFTKGKPEAQGGVDQMLLGTTERDDGKTQATYNGHPLYYYVNEGPNEVRCSNVNSFGGLWFAVAPSGDQV